MACVSIKRSLDFEPIHPGVSTGCSPRPMKRRKGMPPMCVQQSPPRMPESKSPKLKIEESSFFAVTPTLTQGMMTALI